MNKEKITIIGAGHGGYSATADMILKGYDVTLYELPEYRENLFPLIKTGKLRVTGEIQGIVDIPKIEIEINKAIEFATIILIITHGGTHRKLAEMMAPFIKGEQIIVLLPGYTGGALCFEQIFKQKGVKKGYTLAEANTLPYACRKITGEPAVHVKLYLKKFLISAFPAVKNDEFLSVFQKLYPNAHKVENVLETGFNNGNPVLNVVPCVFNAGRIEYAKGEYQHFQEGVTPSVARVMGELDLERIGVGKSLGIKLVPYLERVMETGYVQSNASWYEAIQTSLHLTAKGPDSLQHRYLTEDVPYGLTPWYHFAKDRNIDVKLMESLIQLASALSDENYFETGRTLEEMGINDMTNHELNQFLLYGS
ncbi:NAD/NADP octopine/nopaline dehydrogenase family protein [Paenisporosarcina antarctica]|nr:NAD/NADP octopine/nopaline dehydrogenase family protein [Paenisporosarcina antarctica]